MTTQFNYSKHEERTWERYANTALGRLMESPEKRGAAALTAAGIADYMVALQRLRFEQQPEPTVYDDGASEPVQATSPVVAPVPVQSPTSDRDEPTALEPETDATPQLDVDLVERMAEFVSAEPADGAVV